MMCLLLGGPTYYIDCNGTSRPFELHHYCGPHPLHKTTGDPLDIIPPGFWDAIERWEEGGKRLDGDKCIVPAWCNVCDGRGEIHRHIGGKHWVIDGPCKKCDGKGIVFKE